MNAISDLILRALSTLIATLATVVIIAERQRRINNAKIELAARYIEDIDKEVDTDTLCKDVVKELQYAENIISEISWRHISRASKIDKIVQITRRLAHERQKHEKLLKGINPEDPLKRVKTEIEAKKFALLGKEIRSLKTSFIDFIFIS